MLNLLSDLETAAEAHAPFSAGACLPSGPVQTAQPRQSAVVHARPRAFWAADVFGHRRPAADPAVALGQQDSQKKNPYMTRIAVSGGAKGPHPAREPEPA